MLKIGDFSKLSRVSIRMLRHYDEIGLLIPASTDDFTSYRYYKEEQLPVVNRITALKEMGFSLATITEVLKNYNNPETLAQFLLVKRAETNEQVEQSKRRLKLLETAITRLRKDETMMKYDVTVKTLPERYVASVRKVIPSYQDEGMLWNILGLETTSLKMQYDEPCYSLAMFHDDGHKESDVDVEIQMNVKGSYNNTENVQFKTVPPIQFASATYKGSYEQVDLVNEAVATWVSANGYEFDDMMFCIYHVSPHDTQNPDEYVTEVCYSVKRSA